MLKCACLPLHGRSQTNEWTSVMQPTERGGSVLSTNYLELDRFLKNLTGYGIQPLI